ncbi:MAG: thioesterase family protein [Pseudomonadota bacterium]|nr:thioesterase family protein [Pseudomonadota bacterium]
MQFSELLKSLTGEPGISVLEDPQDWLQGRAMFGGLQTVVCLHAMRSLIPKTPLRSLQTTFVQPARSSRVTARASLLREGKNVSHLEARLQDDEGNLVALVTGVFGVARQSQVEIAPLQPAVGHGKALVMPDSPKAPRFTRHFDARWLVGKLPFMGDDSLANVLELSMPGEKYCTEYHVVALADYIPPVALSHLRKPAMGSSVTWMLEFLSHEYRGLSLQHWRLDAELMAAEEGYTHQSIMLWSPDSKPIALSRQNMVIFG